MLNKPDKRGINKAGMEQESGIFAAMIPSQRKKQTRRGFTLIELLTVIGIIAVLAAILFPVFATVRGKARQTACVSNLRQIGMAVQMYAQDFDGLPPYAADASDKTVVGMWDGQPKCQTKIQEMPWLHYHKDPTLPSANQWTDGVLDSYLKSHDLWRCAGDTGFDRLDNNFDPATGTLRLMDARPTMYEAFGASYLFHTTIAFSQVPIDSMQGKDFAGRDIGPAQINLLFDGNGSWHGQPFSLGVSGLRYVTLFLDGHAKLLTNDDYQRAWASFPDINPCP